jgi:hypothetical protein
MTLGVFTRLQKAAAAFLSTEPTIGQPYFAPSGTAVVVNGSATVTGTATHFTTFTAGKPIAFFTPDGVLSSATVASIEDATHLTLTVPWAREGGVQIVLPPTPAAAGLLPIPTFTARAGTLQDAINSGLGRTGMSVLVKAVSGEKARNNATDGIAYGETKLIFLTGCTPKANPCGLDPESVAEMIAWVMRKFSFRGSANATAVTPEHEGTHQLERQQGLEDQVHWLTLFKLAEVRSETPPTR